MSAPTSELVRNFVGGKPTRATADGVLPVVNPATGRQIASVAASNAADVAFAVTAARDAAEGWAATSPAERHQALHQVADLVAAHFDELAELEAVNAGKPITAVRDEELPGVIDAVRLFAATARSLPGIAAGEYVPGNTSFIRREPIGVVGAITPWNYPLLQAVAKLVPAIAVGNTVVLKPAEATPLSTLRFAELAGQVLPPGVLNVITGTGPEAGQALVTDPAVGLVSFTGSVAGGSAVAAAAAANLKKTVLELGGNAPAIVFEDADLDQALDALLVGGLYNAGQECMASSRILVHRSRHDSFVEGLVERARATVVGDTLDPATQLGPLISPTQRERVEALLARRGDSARVVTGGGRTDSPGFFLEPTVVVGVDQGDELVQQEIFGPVFTVQAFDDDDRALRMANDTAYGLAASVWTRDIGRAFRVTNRLTSGTVWINNHLAFGPDLPVSGHGDSGYGVENNLLGVTEFTQIKHVAVNNF
ncbi:aldehyde dehydrogenase family protein [Streptomyces sp. NBC_01239]|uniref:aldehyde dehydrogenase family protein n=1 Tax=Streptomyces sp. NBC_01239 TaxID=2903792 RepID=UPI002259AE38|nr:aldehyde dehydrogenase family protein [Streptomyces sp. NBC_01239]MCX4816492.1 aldehyde dehydrogenase family protein [Streptomyces sp. NBC_01239]